MLQFNINLTSLAVILWSGMLVIAGSVWVLSSQVRKVADLIEEHSGRTAADSRTMRGNASTRVPRTVVRRAGRAGARNPVA